MHGGMENPAVSPAMSAIRKGPWVAEEDAVLIDYVRKYGPRDWSSIRSKGLLPRTGKSCRLRWVNKLKPDLKTGCKFSAEEERIVLDLQARFGNKWARIATYLPGRTDNDVKNFWSTRQKRLARLLQTPLPTKSHRDKGKSSMSTELAILEPNVSSAALPHSSPCLQLIPFEEECSKGQCSHAPYADCRDGAKAEQMFNLDATLPLIEPSIADIELFEQSGSPMPQPLFDQPSLDLLPLLPESQDFMAEFGDMSFPGHFACAETSRHMQLPGTPPLFDMDVGDHGIKIENPGTDESFFDDFPADMFDSFEQPPTA